MSIRKTLYFAAIMMTLIPLLIFVIYENDQFDRRTIAEHEKEFISFSRANGDMLIDTSQYIYSQIWLSTRDSLNITDLREDLESPEEAGFIYRLLVNTVLSIGTTDKGISKISDLLVLDIDGTIITSNNTDLIGMNIAGTPLYDTLTSDSNTSSSFMESAFHSGEYGLWLTRRFSGDLFLSAFVASDVYSLDHFSFSDTGVYTVLSWQGVIISHPDKNLVGTVIDNEEIVRGLANFNTNPNAARTGSGSGQVFGAEQIYGYYVINEFGGAVCVFQQKNEILNSKLRFVRDGLLFALLVGVLSLLIFVPVLRVRIIKPILSLRKSINFAYEGKYQVCEMHHNDEIGELVCGFNRLIEQIEEHISELEHSNEVLREMEERLVSDRERLKVSEQRFKFAADISTIAIFELIPYTNEYFHSDSWSKITTYQHGDVYPLEYVIHNIIHPDYRQDLIEWLDNLNGFYDQDLKFFTIDGSLKWIHISMAIVEDEETGKSKISGTLTDINERMTAQEYSDYLAYHEPLTGFPRRNMFCDEVSKKLTAIKKGNWGLVITFNVANVRRINDTFGFQIGDRVIVLIAETLKKSFGNSMYYARNSGDSFLLFTTCPENVEYIDDLCKRILKNFRKPLLVNNMSVAVDIRMGASVYPVHGYHVEELIQYADIAMIEAWYTRGTEFALFDPIMMAKIRRTHQIMQILQEFEENKVLRLVYQPIVDTNKKCQGFEALVRIDVTNIGFISPAEFIPLAEDARLIIPMGREILRDACLKTLELINSGNDFEYMSVNVSPIQLQEGDFVDVVLEVIRETGMPPNKLQLEVTESVMLSNVDDTNEKLATLRNKGIRIALDDFGTGYSSMKYLRTIPLDVLKIDKHFVDELESDDEQIFAVTMIQLAHKLGLKVVAEGVETKNQFDILKSQGCDCIQGYFVSRPLNADVMADFIHAH